jgi:hypothetical protein
MILATAAALLLAQLVPYDAFPKRDQVSRQQCSEALLSIHVLLGKYDSFVSTHEIDEGGRLTVDQAVVYRLDAANLMRPYMDEIQDLRERPDTGERCWAVSKHAENEFWASVMPLWASSYGYTYSDGRWHRPVRRQHPDN